MTTATVKQPKYCQRCGKELIYWEDVFSQGTTYDIYTGEPHPYKNMYRAWVCPRRNGGDGMTRSEHDLYRVVDPEKFEWEKQFFMGWELND